MNILDSFFIIVALFVLWLCLDYLFWEEQKAKPIDDYIQCTCKQCIANADKYNSLYIEADVANEKELRIEIWDWRGEHSSSIFLYLDKEGTGKLIRLLEKQKKDLK